MYLNAVPSAQEKQRDVEWKAFRDASSGLRVKFQSAYYWILFIGYSILEIVFLIFYLKSNIS
jgi:hypothetical protein